MIAALDDADFLIVNSDFTRRQYLERGVRSDQRFLKVNPGVDTSLFRPDAGDPLGVRRRFGLGDRPIVLSVARLVEQKGHDNVLRAFPQILTRVPEAIYVIAGDGPFRPDLERLARELGLEGRVVFAGFVPEAELPSYYRAADVVVVPSREFRKGVPIEGFGMVYVEAGACGTPAVGGRGGGTEESIEDGVTGLRVDAEDPAAIGDAVARLLSDRELASRFGAAGRRRALERFDWTIQAEVLRGFLDELPGAAAASRERVGKL
jgi:phosphatidylinositol alpha-1,6-mannosyltransferase